MRLLYKDPSIGNGSLQIYLPGRVMNGLHIHDWEGHRREMDRIGKRKMGF